MDYKLLSNEQVDDLQVKANSKFADTCQAAIDKFFEKHPFIEGTTDKKEHHRMARAICLEATRKFILDSDTDEIVFAISAVMDTIGMLRNEVSKIATSLLKTKLGAMLNEAGIDVHVVEGKDLESKLEELRDKHQKERDAKKGR